LNEIESKSLAPDRGGPGKILAAARAERGMSVPEVAQRLKFSVRHIEALEADHYDLFPPGPYVRGMMRTYARLLGVDPAPLLESLPGQAGSGEEPAMQPHDMSVPFPQDARPGSRVYLLLSMLIIVAVVVVLAEWFIRSQRGAPVPEAVPPVASGEPAEKAEPLPDPVPMSAQVATAPAAQSAAPPAALPAPVEAATGEAMAKSTPETPAPALAAAPSAAHPAAASATAAASPGAGAREPAPAPRPVLPGQSQLRLTFELESWVEIKDANGDVILSAINAPGTEKEVVGTGPFTLVIGNASGVRLTHNGEAVKLAPHRTSDVARLTLE